MDLNREFEKYVDATVKRGYYWLVGETPPPLDVRQVMARTQYLSFKDHIEMTKEWKNILDWRKVGEWLNKYDERTGVETTIHEAETGRAANRGKAAWKGPPIRATMPYLPRAQVAVYDPFRYVKEW